MKGFLFILLSLFHVFSFGQKIPDNQFFQITPDSALFEVSEVRTKEMTLPGQPEIYELIGKKTLSSKEALKFQKKLASKSSYSYGRALLNHSNISVTFYTNEKETLLATISTLTRNIELDISGRDPFYGKISKKLGRYLIKLLVKFGYYDQVKEMGDLEGVE